MGAEGIVCDECDGTGYTVCVECGGSGKIDEEYEEQVQAIIKVIDFARKNGRKE